MSKSLPSAASSALFYIAFVLEIAVAGFVNMGFFKLRAVCFWAVLLVLPLLWPLSLIVGTHTFVVVVVAAAAAVVVVVVAAAAAAAAAALPECLTVVGCPQA